MKKLSIFAILICIAISAFSVTYNLGLSPLKTEVEMYPGDIQTFELNLVNGTLADVNYQLEIGTFTLDKNGAYIYLTKDSTYTFSCANWIKFPNNEINLNVRALQTSKIQISIEVPRSVRYGGDYYAMVWANFIPKENTPTSSNATGTGISIERRFRFGSIVHVTVKGRPANSKLALEGIEIVNLDAIATSTQRGLRISAIVKNSGDTSFRPTGDYLIVSSNNKVWGRGDLTMDHTDLVMPQIEREMYALYDRSLPAGEYTVKINLKSGERFLSHKEETFSMIESTSASKPLDVNVLLSPSEITGDVKAGTNQMGKFELSNREFSTISATVDTVTLSMDENGYWIFGSQVDDVKLYPDNFTLREDQKRVIPFSYKVPQDATGLYAFALRIKTSVENSSNLSTFYIPVMMRITGTTRYNFEITNVEKIMPSTPTDKAFLRVWIKNTGNTFTNFNIIYDIVDPQMNYLTLQAQYLSESGFSIFPSVERYVDIPIGNYKIVKTGEYHVPMMITYKGDKNSNQQIKTEITFEITQDDLVRMGSVQS
ncbi:hypothetical protein [Athalassotoga sp.]|uniref:hypothetical protein n=1 Tax=Athalassotoga sp. TaxID=2022597 RepID=UPI003CFE79EA